MGAFAASDLVEARSSSSALPSPTTPSLHQTQTTNNNGNLESTKQQKLVLMLWKWALTKSQTTEGAGSNKLSKKSFRLLKAPKQRRKFQVQRRKNERTSWRLLCRTERRR